MYNVLIDIAKSIENIIISCNKEFNNKVFNMSIFYEVSNFFQIEIISNEMFRYLQPKRSQSDILQMAGPNSHGHVVQPEKQESILTV